MEGWIKWHRKVLDNPIIMKDKDYFAVWGYLLLKATHKNHDTLFKGKRITLKPGQLIIGRKSIAEKLKIDESKVQRILKSFENEQQIEQQTTSQNRLISILNWHEYQESEQQNEQQVNNDCTTSEQRVNTNKNEKNIKNDKNVVVENKQSDSCVDEIVEFYNNNFGVLITEHIFNLLKGYEEEMGTDVVIFALQLAVENNARNFKYVKAILNSWSNKGIKTLEGAKQENKNRPKKADTQEFAKATTDNWEDFYDN